MLFTLSKFKIIGAVVLVIVVVIIAVLYSVKKPMTDDTVISENSAISSQTAGKLNFNIGDNRFIEINDFVDSALQVGSGKAIIFDDPAIARFTYDSKLRSFFLVYNEGDTAALTKKQKAAEKKVMSVLGVNSKDVCSLPIQVTNEAPTLPVYFETCRVINNGDDE